MSCTCSCLCHESHSRLSLCSRPCCPQVFPQGWDKTYCLQFVEKDFDTVHFFGDKTYEVRQREGQRCPCAHP